MSDKKGELKHGVLRDDEIHISNTPNDIEGMGFDDYGGQETLPHLQDNFQYMRLLHL